MIFVLVDHNQHLQQHQFLDSHQQFHGTVGGYPKIGVVASVDYDRLVQKSPGSKIKFKEINLSDAETLFKLYEMETQNLLLQI